jgi:hypothetical protein
LLVYLTLDIDALDPALAPGTGTPVPGGISNDKAQRIIRGLAGLNIVAMDVVEVAPAYHHAEITALAAAAHAELIAHWQRGELKSGMQQVFAFEEGRKAIEHIAGGKELKMGANAGVTTPAECHAAMTWAQRLKPARFQGDRPAVRDLFRPDDSYA